MAPIPTPLAERFWPKVNKRGPKQSHMKTRCWLWTGADNGAGYGMISVSRSRSRSAHRVSWELSRKKKLPASIAVRHRCDTPMCVRPSHLVAGSQQKNLWDMSQKGRSKHKKLTPEQVTAIKQEYATGSIGHRPLAVKYGVSRAMIRSIVSGQSWKWLDD